MVTAKAITNELGEAVSVLDSVSQMEYGDKVDPWEMTGSKSRTQVFGDVISTTKGAVLVRHIEDRFGAVNLHKKCEVVSAHGRLLISYRGVDFLYFMGGIYTR